ncbi:rotatin-like [Mytilus californianus]|uniref:rotatin-like n=1 Tax=Mytilus californianus TaxID=6549 RepID=UPI0022479E0B|nr:rotatin-like [Mytilus californianus]
MTTNLRQDINFQALFKKLGHDLEEIRIRALENLLSKLEHKLICDADLIHERHLLIRIVEWFNFPNSTSNADVLKLLLRLTQHSPAAEILQDIGGIEFLSQLRKDVSSSLQPLIDQILENTMRLPEIKHQDHAPECIYQKQENQTGFKAETTVDTLQSSLPPANQDTPYIAGTRDDNVGYFNRDAIESVQQQQQYQQNNETASSFILTTFPWLALTSTDRHVILSTNSSLQSRESHLLASSCEFLSDVVFRDFPSEIFLQRPNIVKNLLSLLGSTSNQNVQLTIHAAKTLGDLAACLMSRIRYYQDPSLYTPKQDFCSPSSSPFSNSPSSLSNHSAPPDRNSFAGWTDPRPRGDGRDGDSSTSSRSSSRASSLDLGGDIVQQEETDLEDMQSLQYVQMTVPQFCGCVLDKALPLLKTGNENVVTQLLYLVNQILDILSSVITLEVWNDVSSPAREIVEKLSNSFETLGNLILYHHYRNNDHDNESNDLIQHRLAYIGICCFLARLLQEFVPYKMARNILPTQLVSAIGIVVFDEGLSQSYSDVQIKLLAYLEQVDREKYNVYVSASRVCQSMQKTCKFLMLCQQEAYQGSCELAELADESIHSLPYHLHLTLVSEFVKLSSSVCARSEKNTDLQINCRSVLLRFLAHPLPKVRLQTYSTIFQVIKGCLSVDEASDPNSDACMLSRFLLDPDILYEISVFGLNDKDTKVSKTSNDLVCHLLDSQLFMTEELWTEFLTNLHKSLPIIQSYADSDSTLGKCIMSMIDPLISTCPGQLPYLEKLRGTLRVMFTSDIRCRAEALKRLAWFLSNEENSQNKQPAFSSLDVANLTNIFIVETQRSLDEDYGRSVFQVDGLRKVYEIFKSDSVDPGVKKSAVDQLAIILQDHNLHSPFKNDGGVKEIIKYIKLGIMKPDENTKNESLPFVPSCVTVLRYLVHHDYVLRHKLAHDTEIYMNLLRVAFLNQNDERLCYDVAHLFVLFLFDEVAKFDLGGGQTPVVTFSIPHVLKKRFRQPFRPNCHHETSPNVTPLASEPDPLLSDAPAEMLKVAWHVSWHNGMENLLKNLRQNKNKSDGNLPEFSAKLHLSYKDKMLLQASHLKEGLQQAIYTVCNATSHSGVSQSLHRLLSYIMAAFGFGGSDMFFSMEWFNSIGRFLKVTPSNTTDESLLQEVLSFVSMALRMANQIPDNTLQLIGELLYQTSGPLIGLLHRAAVRGETRDVPENVNIKRTLDKELLSFISTYNSKLPYLLCRRLKIQQLRGDLVNQLVQRLNVTDAPHFYNLASLEGTLQCLMHITARPGWSQESTDLESYTLCVRVLNCLLEVVSAFHIGRGGTSMSYMGKGVTKAATLCLRHLSYEMATLSEDKDWPKQWGHKQNRTGSSGLENGLNWMLTLWAYRDPEVRTAGLGIAVALTSTEAGRIMMTLNCKHIPGGIWGAALSILLDHTECSMVRQQAALLLVNLTSQSMPCGTVELQSDAWQGPIVTDTEFEVSLVGLSALLALLHHSQFYSEVLVMLSNFYAQPVIQPDIWMQTSQQSPRSSESTFSSVGDVLSDSQQHSSTQFTDRRQLTMSTTSSSRTQHSAHVQQGDSTASSIVQGDVEYPIIVTPSLVSSVCQFIKNIVVLAPQDTFTCLKKDNFIQIFTNLINTNLLEAYMKEMEESCLDQYELVFCDLLQMYASVLDLLRACVIYDTPIRQDILSNNNFLLATLSLLTITYSGSTDVTSTCHELWISVFQFLSMLLQVQGASALESITQAVPNVWDPLSENVQKILDERLDYSRNLYITCLQFLSVLFSEEGKLQGRQPELSKSTLTITQLLNEKVNPDSEDKDEVSITTGCRLCKALTKVFDYSILKSNDYKSPDRIHSATALRNLLAICVTAKSTALDMGLVENIIEHVKQTHAKLNLESLQINKANKKKEESHVQELILTFDLLRNFIFKSLDAKMACFYSGLHNMVHRLWTWCLLDSNLLSSSLALLTTFVAKCPTATSSLAYSSPSATTVTTAPKTQQLSTNSLVHCLIKLVSKDNMKESQLKMVFSLLATLTLSSECRNIMFKSNFLSEFAEMNPRKTKKTKKQQFLEVCWLELLLNLSFSVEGQQMILKIKESVDLLLDFMECSQGKPAEVSTLIIRNLCCHSSNKPKLLANDKLLPEIMKCVDGGIDPLQRVAISALWALVYNNQKAKVMMKNANLLPKLQEKMNNMYNQQALPEKCLTDLQCVIEAVSE